MNKQYIDRSYLVVGCGGLGCYIVEGLIRLNVKKIVVCDPDIFSESNLNRQLYSSINTIGKSKVEVAKNRAKELGYQGEFVAYPSLFDVSMLEGIDVVFDGLDSIKDRLLLEDYCNNYNVTLIHGAVEGNAYQVGVCLPGKNLLHEVYKDAEDVVDKKTNVITVMMCASKQLALITLDLKEYFETEEITF